MRAIEIKDGFVELFEGVAIKTALLKAPKEEESRYAVVLEMEESGRIIGIIAYEEDEIDRLLNFVEGLKKLLIKAKKLSK